jgi:hypothetical protein
MSVTKVTGMMQTSTKGGDIPSASPTVIDTDGDYFDVTGTTNFAAFTVVAGRRFTIQFDGALTMTHHASTLDLPGAANITTAAGDVAEFFATGTNTVQCVNYTKADGTAVAGGGFTQQTIVATTSGTEHTFSSIPSGTRVIHIMFAGISLSGSDQMGVTIGDSGGLETSGYISTTCTLTNGGSVDATASTAMFLIRMSTGSTTGSGQMILTLQDTGTFAWSSSFSGKNSTGACVISGGDKALSAELTQLSVVTTGSDTFDAGTLNIQYI